MRIWLLVIILCCVGFISFIGCSNNPVEYKETKRKIVVERLMNHGGNSYSIYVLNPDTKELNHVYIKSCDGNTRDVKLIMDLKPGEKCWVEEIKLESMSWRSSDQIKHIIHVDPLYIEGGMERQGKINHQINVIK